MALTQKQLEKIRIKNNIQVQTPSVISNRTGGALSRIRELNSPQENTFGEEKPTEQYNSGESIIQKMYNFGKSFRDKPQEEKGIGRKIVDFFTKSEQAFGDTLGQTFASRGVASDITDEAVQGLLASGNKLITLAQATEDKDRKQRLLDMARQDLELAGVQWKEVLPAIEKTSKQIAGEGLGVFADIASVGQYGGAAKSFQLGKIKPIATGAKTAGQAFIKGAKKAAIEGTAIGAGFGASEAMQENKSTGEIIKDTTVGGITGGIISGVIGGLSARHEFLRPEKAAKLKEKAIAQYKKGLKATKDKYKEQTNKIIPQLLEDKTWGTKKSLLKKAQDGIALSSKEYEALGELKGVVEIDGIINMIDDAISSKTLAGGVITSVDKSKVRALKALRADILAVDAADMIVDNVAGQQNLRELAAAYGRELYETRKSQKTIMDNKTLSQVKKVDSAIRELLSNNNPTYSDINKVFTLNTNLADILNETAIRKESGSVINLVRTVAAGSGGAVGATGGPIGSLVGAMGTVAFTEILNSTWWNTLNAVRKAKIADKLLTKSGAALSNALILLARQGAKSDLLD